MKELTVVFPIHVTDDGVIKILMGKKAPGTKMEGIRNGYGGKCEEGEAPIDCAVREVKEETDLDLEKEKLIHVGKIIEGDKHVHFFVYFFGSEIQLSDSEKDFVDNRWFVLKDLESYIHEMLPGNNEMMIQLPAIVQDIINKNPHQKFLVDLSDNEKTMELTKQIYGENKL